MTGIEVKKLWTKSRIANILIIILVIVPMIIAPLSHFSSVDSMKPADQHDLAKLIATLTFPMSGILIFILGQALTLLADSKQHGVADEDEEILYSSMCKIAGLTIIECIITSLISVCAFKSGCDLWLVVALCILLSIFTLIIANAILFYHYKINEGNINV